ncbi:unnamed protein product [Lupinus luteus]|uniref:Uncharacterized protein n=1 Tax=Lupinus luteus TaxID=3873 RepID=A0AAV1X184_LUPLU
MDVIKKEHVSFMVVEVGIGTFHEGANKSYLLKMSTMSDITWTQREDCRTFDNGHCYPLNNVMLQENRQETQMRKQKH